MKLTKPQQELYDAMKHGVQCIYLPPDRYNDGYYFRADNHVRCTKQARALFKAGLVERFKESWQGHRLQIKPETELLDQEARCEQFSSLSQTELKQLIELLNRFRNLSFVRGWENSVDVLIGLANNIAGK